ncbi:macrophage mannose receptor 1 [Xyrichtys novacula]|uniref:Macrophage mannose receptor 1 n=1 Tax=Xyrichtys novacula TaxID=13765 RepID=A0AAV1FKX7_XYRNO|nr:macrophage mannose receptor 1 [Xyrichtys novacula]
MTERFILKKRTRSLHLLFLSGFCTFAFGSSDFYLIKESRSYNDAKTYCREMYTDLASVHNLTDMNNLITLVSFSTARAWIGLESEGVRKWHWSRPYQKLNFYNWKAGEPKNTDEDACAVMDPLGKWFESECGTRRSFVCQGNIETGGHVFVAETKSWRDAQNHCRSLSSELVSIHSQEENNAVHNISASQNVWIGLFKDPWRWSDGSNSSFRFWKPGQPNYLAEQDCVVAVFRDDGRWNDLRCGGRRNFVCRGARKVIPEAPIQPSTQLSQTTTEMPTNLITFPNTTHEVTTTHHFIVTSSNQSNTANTTTEEAATTINALTPNVTDFVSSTSATQLNSTTTGMPNVTTTQLPKNTTHFVSDTSTTQLNSTTTGMPNVTTTQLPKNTTHFVSNTLTTQLNSTTTGMPNVTTTQLPKNTTHFVSDTSTTQLNSTTTGMPNVTTTQLPKNTTHFVSNTSTTQLNSATTGMLNVTTTQLPKNTTHFVSNTSTTQLNSTTTGMPNVTTTQLPKNTTHFVSNTSATQLNSTTTGMPNVTTTQLPRNTTNFVSNTSTTQLDNATTGMPNVTTAQLPTNTTVKETTAVVSATTTMMVTSTGTSTQRSSTTRSLTPTPTESSQSLPSGKLILIKENLTWIDAMTYCRRHHVDLVHITSEHIQDKVAEKAKHATSPHVWLGLHYACNLNFWFWTSSSRGCYQNWAPGQGSEVKYDCDVTGAVEATGGHQWVGLSQTEKLNFICSTCAG